MKNCESKKHQIGALILDIGGRCISAVAKAVNCCRKYVSECKDIVLNNLQILSNKHKSGRKKTTDKYPNLLTDISSIIEKYINVDPHFKTDILYVSVSPNVIIEELVTNYNYPKNSACYKSIKAILKKLGYKLSKIKKSKVINKIAQTDEIFDNVNDVMEEVLQTEEEGMAAISIDDKATKK